MTIVRRSRLQQPSNPAKAAGSNSAADDWTTTITTVPFQIASSQFSSDQCGREVESEKHTISFLNGLSKAGEEHIHL